MKEDKKVPQLRFPEFTDAWKQRKFGDSFDFLQNNTLSRASLNDTSGCAKNVHYGDILVKFGESISAEKADLPFICDREILKKLSKSILKNGDVVIADTAEDMTTGKSCEIVDVDECMPVLAGLHTIPVRPKQKFGKYYLGYYLNSEAFHSQLIPLIQGIKVYSISKSSIKDTVVMFPDDVQEQEKIGSLFNRIDNTITLQQRKLNSLQKLKKGLLQKMFPKNGENITEIRFPEFSDAWKQRKVKELCSISTGKSNTQDKVDDGEYPFYVRSPIVERSKKYLYDEEAVLTVGDGVGTGKVFHYVNGKYDLHQRCYRMFNFSEELNAKYFYHIFSKMFYKRVMSMTAKTSVDSVRMDMIADMEIPVPNIKEQEKIGAFFSDIDNLITLQQRKLESLQKLKKGLLQQMFI